MEMVKLFLALVLVISPAVGDVLTLMVALNGTNDVLDQYFITYYRPDNDPDGTKHLQSLPELVKGGTFRSLQLNSWRKTDFYVEEVFYLVLNERAQVMLNMTFKGTDMNLWWFFMINTYHTGLPFPSSQVDVSRIGEVGQSWRVWERSNASSLFLVALNAAFFSPDRSTLLLLSAFNAFAPLPPTGYEGCYTMSDVESQLTIATLTTDMTVAKCVLECVHRNRSHAALKSGDACLCGNDVTLVSLSKSKDCNSACKGDHRFYCGGSSTTSIFNVKVYGDFGQFIANTIAANDPRNSREVFSVELTLDEETIDLGHVTHVTSVGLSHDDDVDDLVNFTLTFSEFTDSNCSDPQLSYLPLLARQEEANTTEELTVASNVTTAEDVALARMTCLKVKRSWSGSGPAPNVTLQAFGPTGNFIIVPAVAVQISTSPLTTIKTTTSLTTMGTMETTTQEECDCCDICPLSANSTLANLLTTCYGLLPGRSVPSNLTLDQYVSLVQGELSVVKSALSAERRKLTSADDDRPSAQALGTIAAVVIATPFLMVFFTDLLRALKTKHPLTSTGARRTQSVQSTRTNSTVVSEATLISM